MQTCGDVSSITARSNRCKDKLQMAIDNCITKTCTKCGETKPIELFSRDKSTSKVGIRNQCKACRATEQRQRRIDKGDEVRAYDHQRYLENPERKLASSKRSATKRRDKIRVWSREYYHKRLEHFREVKYISGIKRKTLKQSLPYDFTIKDRRTALNYFHGCCAVCGRQLNDLFGTIGIGMDHWIPLSSPDCPGTLPQNIVPLCNGVGGCNQSKLNKNALIWLTERFGYKAAIKINNRVQDYFTWLEGQTNAA